MSAFMSHAFFCMTAPASLLVRDPYATSSPSVCTGEIDLLVRFFPSSSRIVASLDTRRDMPPSLMYALHSTPSMKDPIIDASNCL
eukprot:7376412-Prymnesium_polylepis.1